MTLRSNITRCDHERLVRFVDGSISQSDATELELHLEHCETCSRNLDERSAESSFWTEAKQIFSSAHSLMTSETDNSSKAVSEGSVGDIPLLPTDDPMMLGRFGGYEISGVIGRGGMGVVLKGWERSLDRYVAVKVLSPTYSHQSAARQRFAREAKAAAAVVHENVVAIHGVDSCNGLPYLVMSYVNGESLQRRIERSAPLSLDSMLEISLQVARGLQAAHDQGLVHRDIKPANILLPHSVSRVLITDFGLARAADDATLTSSGMIAGTPAYMSPEQARGENVDSRTDLFSLGSVMYAMACGHPPFRSESSYGTLRRITDERHRPLAQVQSEIPRWFEMIVDRLLEKKPSDRFDSAAVLASHLESCLAHLRQPQHASVPRLMSSPRTRRRRLLLASVVTAMVGAAMVACWPSDGIPPTPPASGASDIRQVQTPSTDPVAAEDTLPVIVSNEDDLQWDHDFKRLEQMLNLLNQDLDK